MTMLLFVIIVAICGITVKGECQEADYQQRIQTCIEKGINTGVSKDLKDMTGEEKQATCSNYIEGITCAQGVLNDCADSPQLMFRGNSLDEMRAIAEEQRNNIEKFCATA
ncbi:uncharacterized protein LOC121390781 [Gigantopelta aegis]|uniref:uncharacterized protein LOC121390781 n=1 Tax=Gigantopelta aegis TaxID=1735272 RepID=UPI001B88D1DA|nr:uncharacterized protein LOC121390781 [Gigantopelta aegis]